ncbi:DNA polymerase III subunit gamma and tau [Arthrobacter ulcerisalmonis]|uniref:DNA polymerase III subunit gamma and tau n=1 Tax=Arthrobacter ulcerisalmonis TaxID=2483813 RepID=UPI00363AB199
MGQEHVTEPLMTALRKNRVNHAYLFSGPRGCGKTTSARILARCLNCAAGPTDTPCGVCPSCIELARGGSGSLDVIEIDAASHGGVDDARDLRERATYAPVRDRYKIFIIDEAHMVTSAGFNALLKIVEEPPEHIKFIFATTEPDKVIGTIRSRTHHYPFRLVPPEPLMAYLELLCQQENVPVAPGVLSLVIRAGGGSVRDSLSVLDQLMAGAGPTGLDYELAVALLGYTHASLLDDVVEAVAASDSATVFRAVDRVIQTGHDPRRFVEDLLERFRDLIIVQAMPESAQTILRGVPSDQIARLQNQAHNLGASELSRAADVTNTALTEMTGATSPRLHLELLCARILLPSSEQTERGMAARIDRVERRLNYSGNDVGAPATAAGAGGTGTATSGTTAGPDSTTSGAASGPGSTTSGSTAGPGAPAHTPSAPAGSSPVPQSSPSTPSDQAPAPAAETMTPPVQSAASTADAMPTPASNQSSREPLTAPRVTTGDWPHGEVDARESTQKTSTRPAEQRPTIPQQHAATSQERAASGQPTASQQRPEPTQPTPAQHHTAPTTEQAAKQAVSAMPSNDQGASTPRAATAHSAGGDVEVLRRAWPDVLQALSKIKRSTWALVEPNSQVSNFDGTVLTLAFSTPGLAGAFGRADHAENLRQAIHKTIGIDCQITATAGGGNAKASSEPDPKAPAAKAPPASSADVAWGLAPASAAPTNASEPVPQHSGPSDEKAVAPAPPATASAPAVAADTSQQAGVADDNVAAATSTSTAPLPQRSKPRRVLPPRPLPPQPDTFRMKPRRSKRASPTPM